MKTRNAGYALIRVFKQLSTEQRKTVESMGFGGLLDFNVAETPSTLGYWLLENFDPMACVIKLRKCRELRVEADDVTHVLGIPNGRTVIKRKAKQLPHPVVTEFKSFFTNHSPNITAHLVGDELLTRGADCIWFKRMFLILITTCLIECCGNGYVISRIIPNFEDPDRARELSWGTYIKKCLAEEVIDWRKKKNKPEAFFTGPLMFLMLLYVDRVELMDLLVTRVCPSVKGWTCTLLRQREKNEVMAGGFGLGYPVDRVNVGVQEHLIGSKCRRSSPLSENAQVRVDGDGKSTGESSVQSFEETLLRKSRLVADTISEIIDMVQSAPVSFTEDPNVMKLVGKTEHLLGCKLAKTEVAEAVYDDAEPISTWDNEDFWSGAEITAMWDGLSKGISKRDELRAMAFDSPPFSLGMTQDYPDQVVHGNADKPCPPEAIGTKVGMRTKVTVVEEVVKNGKGKAKMSTQEASLDPPTQDDVNVTKRVTRKAALKKKSKSSCSPFMVRATDAGEALSKVEKELCYWLMTNDELGSDYVVYDEENYDLPRMDIMTLGSGLYVVPAVIDIWSIVLNQKEALQSPSTPARFFSTTDVTMYPIFYPKEEWSRSECEEEFLKKFRTTFNDNAAMTLNEVEIFIFPIFQAEHFYIICFNIKSKRIDIIDNSKAKDELPIEAKYEHIPNTLTAYLAKFLETEGLNTKAEIVANSSTNRPKMAWRDDTNPADCAIYTMRHMEIYFGQPPKQWTAGISTGDRHKKIQLLRAKYCAKILCDDWNVVGKQNLSTSAAFCKEKKIKAGELEVDDILSNSSNRQD
ncbi:hypothetical protein CASFOL_004734 [Castilleja foliolosa]|uniref:Ubiquitin-like protease family profile domain-containing protein n=1 Tax=Castilleja foliolosa TaxID=1961234 RepID=A0ABD3EBR9_9LAMI